MIVRPWETIFFMPGCWEAWYYYFGIFIDYGRIVFDKTNPHRHYVSTEQVDAEEFRFYLVFLQSARTA